MTQGTKDLFASERGVFCILLLLCVTVLVAVGKVTADDWLTFAKYLLVVLVASKTATGALETLTGKVPVSSPGVTGGAA